MHDPAPLTVSQAAEWLGISVAALLALIHAGRLTASNVGLGSRRPRWRVTRDALETFLAAHATSPKRVAVKRRRKALGRTIEFF
ncbi:helix-turn-helix domain-containing protein [Gemmata sp. G18]|uniref:Helix-turn-helix domain-containing protein n=1 Tax=Gemmata palustris TaxID=2822762 RepID=A0ABS5BZ55_9BACT|nr:helix-turn-helix domain-containing protein [Gemmata palustris]